MAGHGLVSGLLSWLCKFRSKMTVVSLACHWLEYLNKKPTMPSEAGTVSDIQTLIRCTQRPRILLYQLRSCCLLSKTAAKDRNQVPQ